MPSGKGPEMLSILLVLFIVVIATNAMFLTFMGISQKGSHEDYQIGGSACESQYRAAGAEPS